MAVTIESIDNELMEYADGFTYEDNEVMAEMKKEMGNRKYKLKEYEEASTYYSQAIDLCPENATYYSNRSLCHMMQGHYALALADAMQSVQKDPKFVKGWIRVAKCNLTKGDIPAAEHAINQAKELEKNNAALQQDTSILEFLKYIIADATKAYNAKDYRKVIYCLNQALEIAVNCIKFKVLKAECLTRLGRFVEAQELINSVLFKDKQNVDAIFVKGMCLYYQDNVDRAFHHFQHVLRLAPDHANALDAYKKAKALKQKKEEGNEAFKNGRNGEAYILYSEALKIDSDNNSTNAKLYFNRATVLSKLGRLNDAIADCTSAIKLDENYVKPLLRRAKCYMDQKQYDVAVKDYKKAYAMDDSPVTLNLLKEAQMELEGIEKKDYYKILGVSKNAPIADIKKAYKTKALVHHPDRHANASETEKIEQEIKFKDVGEAYCVLTDPKKRREYDNDQDIEDCFRLLSKKKKKFEERRDAFADELFGFF